MKKYEIPEIKVSVWSMADIITTSENETPVAPRGIE